LKRPLKAAARSDRVPRAIALMCLYVSLIVFVNAGGKVLTAHCHPFQVVFFRHGGAAVFMTSAFVARHGWAIIIPRRPGLQILRGGFAILSSLLYFTALASTPLATAAAISFTAPLVVTSLSPALLGEKVGKHLWGAVVMGFAGALIIVRPGWSPESPWGALMLLGSACCTGLYQITTRFLAGKDRAETTTIWTGLVGGGVSLVLVSFVWTTPATLWLWLLSLSLGAIGGTGHFLLTKAFERGPASLLSPFNYLQLVGATAMGYALYGQLPDRWTWTGALVIIAAGLFVASRERLRRQAARKSSPRVGAPGPD
jgi:drug/metabolite transporter (DMT)-like permease